MALKISQKKNKILSNILFNKMIYLQMKWMCWNYENAREKIIRIVNLFPPINEGISNDLFSFQSIYASGKASHMSLQYLPLTRRWSEFWFLKQCSVFIWKCNMMKMHLISSGKNNLFANQIPFLRILNKHVQQLT